MQYRQTGMGSNPPHATYGSYHHLPSYNQQGPYLHGSAPSAAARPIDSAMDNPPSHVGVSDPSFDILDWHPAFLSCQRYFLDHAQFEPGTQAVCALINIRLPFQWLATPVTSSTPPAHGASNQHTFSFNAYSRGGSNVNSPRSREQSRDHAGGGGGGSSNHSNATQLHVSPVPYIRRLVVTGFDKAAILHGFFGDDYQRGILPHVECERRNYLFAAKHGGWRSCKKQYDVGSGYGEDETVPFMKPLDEATAQELAAAEKQWSKWLAMEDWMVGPRAPGGEEGRSFEEQERSFAGKSTLSFLPSPCSVCKDSLLTLGSTGSRGRDSTSGLPNGVADVPPDGMHERYRLR